mgnify:CR=1 FL=1
MTPEEHRLTAELLVDGRRIGETEELEVTVLMSDIRGYSGIAERTDPTTLAGQLNRHRAEMNRAIIANGGTVMQFVGDAVMAPYIHDEGCRRRDLAGDDVLGFCALIVVVQLVPSIMMLASFVKQALGNRKPKRQGVGVR